MDAFVDNNPYAPPAVETQEAEAYREGAVWRNGDDMVLANGAEIPPRCLTTGAVTHRRVYVRQSWQPGWLYWLLPLGVLPYLAIAPLFRRYVRLELPIADRVYSSHLTKVKFGLVLIAGSAVAMAAMVALKMWDLNSSLADLLFLPGVIFLLLGFFYSSRSPLKVRIKRLDDHFLHLKHVHPDCLRGLPPFDPPE